MSLTEIKEWLDFLWPFARPIAALACTFTLVSFFKSIIKHSCKLDEFYLKMTIQIMAFIVGFIVAFVFLHDEELVLLWAIGLAILNIPIYDIMLKYAASKQWLTVVAVLKGRKLVVRQENGVTTEKVMDEDDKTVLTRRYTDL